MGATTHSPFVSPRDRRRRDGISWPAPTPRHSLVELQASQNESKKCRVATLVEHHTEHLELKTRNPV